MSDLAKDASAAADDVADAAGDMVDTAAKGGKDVVDAVVSATRTHFERKLETFAEHAERLQSWLLLTVIDDKWKDHLYDLDSLKASISFRGWGQKDPLIEYKKEAYDMFVDLMKDIRKSVTSFFFRAQLGQPQAQRARPVQRLQYSGPAEAGLLSSMFELAGPVSILTKQDSFGRSERGMRCELEVGGGPRERSAEAISG